MCAAKVFDQHRARRAPTTAVTLTRPSRRRALIGDDLAVVRKRAGVDERDFAAQFRQRLERCRDRLFEGFARTCGLGRKQHDVLLPFAAYDQPQRAEFRMTLADLGDLARVDEEAPDLSRLIGAPHPAFEALGRGPSRKIAGREAKERIVALKPCHDDFADLAGRNGFVGPRSSRSRQSGRR